MPDTLSADRQGISPGQTALPGLESAPARPAGGEDKTSRVTSGV